MKRSTHPAASASPREAPPSARLFGTSSRQAPVALRGRLLAVALATLPVWATAASPTTEPVLTLERAIEIALAGNRELRGSLAQLEVAAARLQEARALRLPRLALEAAYQRTDNPVLVFSNLLSQAAFQAESFALDALNHPAPLDNWKTRIHLSQPVWTSGRLQAGVEAAGHESDAAELDREATRQRVVYRVIESYMGAVLARSELAVARESLATARAHVELVADLRQAGLVVESDLLQAEVRESEVRELLIRAENAAEVAVAALNLVLGRDLETSTALPADLAREEAAAPGEIATTADSGERGLERLVNLAWRQRPDLAAARHRLAASERQIRIARAARRPEMGLDASYEMNAEDFFGADGENWALTVGWRLDLFDGHRGRARVDQADRRAQVAEEATEALAQSVALEVRRAYLNQRAARQRLEPSMRGVELARRSLEIVADRYREGLTVLTELLAAETSLTRARLRLIVAERDVLLARASLDLATGDL